VATAAPVLAARLSAAAASVSAASAPGPLDCCSPQLRPAAEAPLLEADQLAAAIGSTAGWGLDLDGLSAVVLPALLALLPLLLTSAADAVAPWPPWAHPPGGLSGHGPDESAMEEDAPADAAAGPATGPGAGSEPPLVRAATTTLWATAMLTRSRPAQVRAGLEAGACSGAWAGWLMTGRCA
jgi:hypothetical protein